MAKAACKAVRFCSPLEQSATRPQTAWSVASLKLNVSGVLHPQRSEQFLHEAIGSERAARVPVTWRWYGS